MTVSRIPIKSGGVFNLKLSSFSIQFCILLLNQFVNFPLIDILSWCSHTIVEPNHRYDHIYIGLVLGIVTFWCFLCRWCVRVSDVERMVPSSALGSTPEQQREY